MSVWFLASFGLLSSLVPAGIVCLRGRPMDRLVGLEMAGVVLTLLLVVLTQEMHRAQFMDLPVAMALLSFGAGLVFARFLERWL